ncbi:MAG: RNA polymerase sigma factor [Planctomycetota bacterium]
MDRRLEHHFRRFRRRGDPRSLGRVFDLSAGELATIARQLVRDPETAEDVVQATYLTAIEKAHVFDGRQRVMPWLIGILARHAARARVAASRTPDPDRLDRAPVRDPADDAANAELGALIDERIADLPDGYASAVRPYLVEGKRPMEIGRALGITANAASVRVHRGLELLRRRLPRTAAPAVAVAMPDLSLVRENVLATVPVPSAAAGAATTAAAVGTLTMKKSILLLACGTLLGSGATRAFEALVEGPRPADAGAAVERLAAGEPDAAPDEIELPRPTRGSRAVVRAPRVDRAEPEAPRPLTADEWLARLLACDGPDASRTVLEQIAALDPDEGLGVMRAIWRRVPVAEVRELALDVFSGAGHPRNHCVLHLGATDERVAVQTAALRRLSAVALVDFALDFGALTSWFAGHEELGYDEVLRLAARDFGTRAALAADVDLPGVFDRLDALSVRLAEAAGVDLPAELVDAGGVTTALERMVALEDDDAQRAALKAARLLGVELALQTLLEDWVTSRDPVHTDKALDLLQGFESSEAFLRAQILPIVENRDEHDAARVHDAAQLLAHEGNDFATDALLDLLLDPGEGVARFFEPARMLAALGDPRVIPTMIAVIRADGTYSSVYGVGYFGLRPLTGVSYDESHDGAFWVDWWAKNRERLPASVHGMSIPYVSFDD